MSKDWQRVAIVGLAFPFKGGMVALGNRLAIELQKTNKDVEIYGFKRLYPYIIFRKNEKITNTGDRRAMFLLPAGLPGIDGKTITKNTELN